MYNYIQQTIDYTEREMAFCEVRYSHTATKSLLQASNTDAMYEMDYARVAFMAPHNRTARNAGYGGAAAHGAAASFASAVTGIPLQQECPGSDV